MKFIGIKTAFIVASLLAAEHHAAHQREASYWRQEWIDMDEGYRPDYRRDWEKQVPEAERWRKP